MFAEYLCTGISDQYMTLDRTNMADSSQVYSCMLKTYFTITYVTTSRHFCLAFYNQGSNVYVHCSLVQEKSFISIFVTSRNFLANFNRDINDFK